MLEQVIPNKAGWTRVTFGDVVRLSKLRAKDPEAEGYDRVVGLEHIDPGYPSVRRWADIKDGTSFTTVFQPGQVLFGKRRAYQRKVAVADFAGVCSSDIYVLEVSSDALLQELLPFICQTDAFFDHAVRTSDGSLSPRTNWKNLASFEFMLPPLQEQARLVEVLRAIENSYSSLVRLANASQQTVLAYGSEILGKTIRSDGVEIGDFSFEDINKIEVRRDEEYRVAGVFNKGAGLYESEIMPGSKTRYKQLHILQHNQIVMRKLTAWEGSIAIVPNDFEGSVVSPEFPTLSLDTTRVQPDYLTWLFRQPPFWREMKAHCRGTAVRRSRLHQRDLMKIRIVLPNLSTQRRVVSELRRLNEAAIEAERRASEVRSILNIVLSDSLSGEVVSSNDI